MFFTRDLKPKLNKQYANTMSSSRDAKLGSLKPQLHVETFSRNLCAAALRNMFQQALHRVSSNVETFSER